MAFRAIVPAMVSRGFVSVVTDKTAAVLKGNSQTDRLNVKQLYSSLILRHCRNFDPLTPEREIRLQI